ESIDAIQRRQLRAADPPCLRHPRLQRARDRRDATPRRDTPGKAQSRNTRSDLGSGLCPDHALHRHSRDAIERAAIPLHPPLPHARLLGAGAPAPGARDMALILDFILQGVQMLLVLALAPLLTGFVRKVKARLLRRQGPPVLQPYRDLIRLMRKE